MGAPGIYSPIIDRFGRNFPAAAMSTDYDAASTGRRMGTWGLSSTGPSSVVSGPLHAIRSRTRTVIRNNPYAAGIVDSIVANWVGTDISPSWEALDSEEGEILSALWADSQEELDYYGIYDFYGMTDQVARAQVDAGEALGIFHAMSSSAGLLVPLQLQLLEADHLDASYDTLAPNGNEIRMGIEWNSGNIRAAYWMFAEHPGERSLGYRYSGERVRYPAGDVLHIFRPLRIGQARGCPWMAPALVALREIDEFDDAALVKKKVANLFSVFFTSEQDFTGNANPPPAPVPFGLQKPNDASNNRVIELEPGLSARLRPGESVVVADPADPGDNYLDFIKTNLRRAVKGCGPITYEQATGDLEGVNYTSLRAGLIEVRRQLEVLQNRILIHQWCRPFVRRWLDSAVLSGAYAVRAEAYLKNRRKYWRVKWQPDGWDFTDPLKDVMAEILSCRAGFESRTATIGRRGRNAAMVDREIAKDNDRADKAGLVFDTDPRKATKSGTIQKAEDRVIEETA